MEAIAVCAESKLCLAGSIVSAAAVLMALHFLAGLFIIYVVTGWLPWHKNKEGQ